MLMFTTSLIIVFMNTSSIHKPFVEANQSSNFHLIAIYFIFPIALIFFYCSLIIFYKKLFIKKKF